MARHGGRRNDKKPDENRGCNVMILADPGQCRCREETKCENYCTESRVARHRQYPSRLRPAAHTRTVSTWFWSTGNPEQHTELTAKIHMPTDYWKTRRCMSTATVEQRRITPKAEKIEWLKKRECVIVCNVWGLICRSANGLYSH